MSNYLIKVVVSISPTTQILTLVSVMRREIQKIRIIAMQKINFFKSSLFQFKDLITCMIFTIPTIPYSLTNCQPYILRR